MEPVDSFGITELIQNFIFREEGGIKILKKWREEAVIMQVDIEIVSVSRQQYLNYASRPASGFYGYATLIMRDFATPSIKITQPRQNLYFARNEFAMSAWMEFSQFVRIQKNLEGLENLICFNTGLLGGVCVPKECKPIPKPSFDEFPLREIFFKSFFGTQFNVEISYWKINKLLDNCQNLVEPKSNQKDGDKDSGMPPFGSQPQEASDPNNPYKKLPLPSPDSTEGIIPDSRINNLDKPNPDNFPNANDIPATTTKEGYYIRLSYSSCSEFFGKQPPRTGVFVQYLPAYSDSVINVTSSALNGVQPCGRTDNMVRQFKIESPTKGVTTSTSAGTYGAINGSIEYGLLPTPDTFDGIPYP